LDGLNVAARALVRAGFSRDELAALLAAEIDGLQRDAGREVAFRPNGANGIWFELVARRPRRSVSVRKPNQVRFLSGKVDGVWVVVNLHKPGVYRHENAHVAQALRALAGAIERAEVPLADHDMELPVEG
jgi:hypothetical protein